MKIRRRRPRDNDDSAENMEENKSENGSVYSYEEITVNLKIAPFNIL